MESPDGKRIMFAYKDKSAVDSIELKSLGVLNVDTGVLTLDSSSNEGWYLYAYDFR